MGSTQFSKLFFFGQPQFSKLSLIRLDKGFGFTLTDTSYFRAQLQVRAQNVIIFWFSTTVNLDQKKKTTVNIWPRDK